MTNRVSDSDRQMTYLGLELREASKQTKQTKKKKGGGTTVCKYPDRYLCEFTGIIEPYTYLNSEVPNKIGIFFLIF